MSAYVDPWYPWVFSFTYTLLSSGLLCSFKGARIWGFISCLGWAHGTSSNKFVFFVVFFPMKLAWNCSIYSWKAQSKTSSCYIYTFFICVCVYFSFFSSSFTIVLVLVIKALHKHRYSIYKWVRLEEKIRRVTNCRQKTNCRLVLNGTYSFSKEKQDRCPFIMEGNRCNIEFQKKIYSILSTVAKAQFITVLTIEGWTWGMQSLIYILLCLFVRVCFALVYIECHLFYCIHR